MGWTAAFAQDVVIGTGFTLSSETTTKYKIYENSMGRFQSRLDAAEKRVSELEGQYKWTLQSSVRKNEKIWYRKEGKTYMWEKYMFNQNPRRRGEELGVEEWDGQGVGINENSTRII